MDVSSLRAHVRDLWAELKETRKELERAKMKLELRMGLQDCLYCEIEMKPKHWENCPDFIRKKQEEKSFVSLPEEAFQTHLLPHQNHH
jgi:hypothetical protein